MGAQPLTEMLVDIGAATKLAGTCLVTTRREIERDSNLARRIVRTYADAVQAFKTRPDAAKVFLTDHLGFKANVIEKIYEFYRTFFQTVPRPSLSNIQIAIDEIAKERPDAARITPADLVEPHFLDEIETASR